MRLSVFELHNKKILQYSIKIDMPEEISLDYIKQLFENSPLSTQILDLNGYTLYVNHAWEHFWNLKFEMLDGYNILQDPQLEANGIIKYIKNAYDGIPAEIPIIKFETASTITRALENKSVWVKGYIYPVKDLSNRIIFLVLTHQDVSDLKEAEQEKSVAFEQEKESRKKAEKAIAQLALITNSLPVYVAYVDSELRYQFINRNYEKRLHITASESLGKTMPTVIGTENFEKIAKPRVEKALLGEGSTYVGKFDEYFIEVNYIPDICDNGEVAGFVILGIDVTTHKQAEEELERKVRERTEQLLLANRELSRSNAALEEFSYIASHDLKEPLRKVQTFGEQLENKYAKILDDQGKDYIDRMMNASRRMQGLIEDLLLYSRVTTKGLPFEEVDLNTIVREVVDDLEIRIKELGAVVCIDTLPIIHGDPIQMRQLFQNLIANALKFVSPERTPEIVIVSKDIDTGFLIEISDNGIGFEDKFNERIFEMFQRLHGRETYEGTGIGLSICKKIVERHNGVITAEGRIGQGSVFRMRLPRTATITGNNTQD